MKNIILSTALILITLSISAQSKYEEGMQKAFTELAANNFTEATAIFERIAQAEEDNWIPFYHAANTLIISAFQEKDPSKREASLEKAKIIIDKAQDISRNNSELVTLEGLLYTGYVAMNPEVYGMQYSGKIMQLHAKAIELDENNPRAHMNYIEYEYGTARFFGSDLAPYCDKMQKIIAKFDAQEISEPFAPSRGKEHAENFVSKCK